MSMYSDHITYHPPGTLNVKGAPPGQGTGDKTQRGTYVHPIATTLPAPEAPFLLCYQFQGPDHGSFPGLCVSVGGGLGFPAGGW